MSADDDDQAYQRHELADPGMAETGYSVLKTPWPQLYSRPVASVQLFGIDELFISSFAVSVIINRQNSRDINCSRFTLYLFIIIYLLLFIY